MRKLVGVIGVGSPIGSDNIAQQIIQLLKEHSKNKFYNRIQFDYYDRPGIYLLELIKNFDVLHLIDAVVSNNPMGSIYRFEDINAFQAEKFLLSSHEMGVAEVLLLGKTLNFLPRKIIIHGIEIDNIKSSCKIPDEIIVARDKLVLKIIAELEKS